MLAKHPSEFSRVLVGLFVIEQSDSEIPRVLLQKFAKQKMAKTLFSGTVNLLENFGSVGHLMGFLLRYMSFFEWFDLLI